VKAVWEVHEGSPRVRDGSLGALSIFTRHVAEQHNKRNCKMIVQWCDIESWRRITDIISTTS